MKITLELNEAQARTILRALDAYGRIGCGQFKIVEEVVCDWWQGERWKNRDDADAGLSIAQVALFPELRSYHASYGIPNREVPLEFRRAYDLKKHIERPMAIAREPNPVFPTVDYDGAILNVSDEPLPRVTVTKEPHGSEAKDLGGTPNGC